MVQAFITGTSNMPDKDDVRLRAARPVDANWIVDRHAVLYAISDGFDDTFREFVERVVSAYFADEDSIRERGWVAEANGGRFGSIFCDATDDPAIARLRLFFLEPQARGLGLGHLLLGECLNFARAAGYEKIVLWTHESHRAACRLYEKHGFERGRSVVVQSFGVEMTEVDYVKELT